MEDAGPRLAVTKFVPPAAPSTLVPRHHHVAALDRLVARRPVTLVAAPAGSGKTVLLVEWVQQRPEGSWAWLSCDVTDAHGDRFWVSVVEACGRLGEAVGAEARALLAEEPEVLDNVVPALVNDLASLDRHTVLVIDDLHVVPSHAVAPLALLVERLPPTAALVLATRSDPPLPLHRWRLNGLLGELRSDELRFSAREAGQLVAANGVDLAPADADALTERTEGWAAGVQLAALTLRGDPDPSAFVRAFAGSDHNVTDYLVGEVLRQLDLDTLDFLLATAALDEFDADRCRALTGRLDAADRLEALAAANLFVVRVGPQAGTYRFHHLTSRSTRRTRPTTPRRARRPTRSIRPREAAPARSMPGRSHWGAWSEGRSHGPNAAIIGLDHRIARSHGMRQVLPPVIHGGHRSVRPAERKRNGTPARAGSG